MGNRELRVIIVEYDDDLRLQQAGRISKIQDYCLVNCYRYSLDALRNFLKDQPSIVIMNIDQKDFINIRKMIEFKRDVRIMIVTNQENDFMIINSLTSGANGYILQCSWELDYIHYLSELSMGGSPLCPRSAEIIVNSLHVQWTNGLTPKENEILGLLAHGYTSSKVAADLFISHDTCRTHIKNIYRKLKVNTKADAIQRAREQRAIPQIGKYL